MTQRLQLLNLHRTLALDQHRQWNGLVHDEPIRVEPLLKEATAPARPKVAFTIEADAPSDPVARDAVGLAEAARIDDDPMNGALAVETLETLVSAARVRQAAGSSLREYVATADHGPHLADLVHSLFADPDDADNSQVTSLIDEIDRIARYDEPQFRLGHRRRQPTGARTFARAIAECADRHGLTSAHVPAVTCSASLIRVRALRPRRGFDMNRVEYATCLSTDVVFAKTGAWTDMSVDALYDTLLDPHKWPACHDFWCAMPDVSNADTDTGGVDLDLARQHFGPDGQDSWLFWEQVGDSAATEQPDHSRPQPRDWFPYTFLYCRRSRSGPNQAYMTYELATDIGPAQADQALTVDSGVINVKDQGNSIHICTTKTIHFASTPRRSEGQSMAAFACASGWGSSARRMAESCRLQHSN